MEEQFHRALIGGIAARFPNSGALQDVWSHLVNGTDMMSPSRWPQGLYNLPENQGLISNVDKFDNEFFDIPESEVNSLNPIFRQLLEVIYECIVDSCLPLSTLQGSRTGLYVACSRSDTDGIQSSKCVNTNYSTSSDYLAGELIQWMRLQGPSVTVNSADSSSISALNLAVSDLLLGKCTYALVTGCDIVLNPVVTHQLHRLEPNLVRSEGCMAVLLARKPEDLSRIYCSLLDIGINHDSDVQHETDEHSGKIYDRLQRVNNTNNNNALYIDNQGVFMKKYHSESEDETDNTIENLMSSDTLTAHIGHTESVAGLSTVLICILAFQQDKSSNCGLFQETFRKLKQEQTHCPAKGNHGDGCMNYYLIIEPYIPTNSDEDNYCHGDIIVPFTVRNTEGMYALMECVKNNRYNTALLRLLSHSLLSCDQNQPIRGYIHAGASESEVSMYHDACNNDLDYLYLCLDEFMSCTVSMVTDLLQLDCFQAALQQCQKSIQLLDPMLDLMSVLEQSQPLIPCSKLGMLAAASLLMSMIDSLETVGVEFDGSIGCGLSEIIAAYMDGCITRDQCFLICATIGKELENFSKKYGDKWVLYHVDIDYEVAYQLGPWVQVLAIYDKQHVTLAVERERCGSVLEKILIKGGSFEQSTTNIPVYSMYMKEVAESVTETLQDILPAPVRRSNHLISARTGWKQGETQEQVFYDADYFAQLLCHPVNLFEARSVTPPDCLVLSLKPSKNHACTDPDKMSPQKKGLQYNAESACTGFLDMELNSHAGVPDHVTCNMSMDSFCHAIGKLHIQGIPVDVSVLYETTTDQSGADIPCLSSLVRWNHHINWALPHWMEFSATLDEERQPYVIDQKDDSQRTMAVLLYHVWKAICDKIYPEQFSLYSIRLYGITGLKPDILHDLNLNGTQIYVLPETGIFAAVLQDEILLTGNFDLDFTCDLPSVPGYDLDINENIDPMSSKLSETDSDQTEIQWEDCWLDFMEKVLEFADENVGSFPTELLINTRYHYDEIQDCSNILTVTEKYTGLCRSGGLVLRFQTPVSTDDLVLENTYVAASISSDSVAKQLMVYGVNNHKTQCNKLLMFNGCKEDGKSVVGIVNFADETKLTESEVTSDWKPEYLEVVVPYMLAAHVVCNIAKVTDKQHVAILPPHDTVSMYMLMLCIDNGCTVYTSTHDIETKHLLEDMFPSLHILHHDGLNKELMKKTQGMGVDVCIRVCGGDLQQLLDCLSWNGHAIQCIAPEEDSYCQGHYLGKNNSITLVDSSQALDYFLQSVDKTFEEIFSGVKNAYIQKLHNEGFPESIGMLYKQEVVADLEKPIHVVNLLQKLIEPDIENNSESLSQHDARCIEKIQSLVSPKPKDFSVADTSCLLENPLKRLGEDQMLDTGMIATPRHLPTNSLSPDVNVIVFSESFAEKKVSPVALKKLDVENKMPPTSTPLVCTAEQFVNKRLEESYLDDMTSLPTCTETSFHIFNDSIREDKVEDRDNVVTQTTPKPGQINEDQLNGKDETSIVLIDDQRKTNRDKRSNSIDAENTNRTLIEESIQESKPEDKTSNKPDIDKESIQHEISTPTVDRPIPNPADRALTRRLSSLGFGRPSTPIVKKTPDRDLLRHRMLHKQNLVPPKLPLPKPKVDLLVFGRPMTPHTPDLQDVLSPRLAPNVVPLNSVKDSDVPPLFIIHTITGCTNMFQNIAKHVDFQCYGLQLTGSTPTGSIDEMAKFYKDVIMMKQIDGPYRIAGHSYSTILALEIAIYLQSEGKEVDYLIMFDGSPPFTQQQINQGLKHLSPKASNSEIDEALSIGALVSWIEHYGQMQNKLLTYGLLKKLSSVNERIETAVDLSFGTAVISCSPVKTKWLTAKEKVIQMMKSSDYNTDRLADAVRELIRLKRRMRALEFINQMQLAYTYQLEKRFNGDIHLFRVNKVFLHDVPADYGLQTMCEGKVHVKQYQANPDKFIVTEAVKPLSQDLNTILNCKNVK